MKPPRKPVREDPVPRVKREVVSHDLCHNAGNSGTQWSLTLTCGHNAIRHRQAGSQNRNWKTYKRPKFVYCKQCGRKKAMEEYERLKAEYDTKGKIDARNQDGPGSHQG